LASCGRADYTRVPRFVYRHAMPTLSNAGGKRVAVTSHLRVGRSPDSGLHLARSYVSLEHAAVRWSGDAWEVKDLGSKNGTFVDGARIASGQSQRIDVGSRIAFGDVEETWELVEADAPGVHAEAIDG